MPVAVRPISHLRPMAPRTIANAVQCSLHSSPSKAPSVTRSSRRRARAVSAQRVKLTVCATAATAPPATSESSSGVPEGVIDCVVVGGGISGLVTAQVRATCSVFSPLSDHLW